MGTRVVGLALAVVATLGACTSSSPTGSAKTTRPTAPSVKLCTETPAHKCGPEQLAAAMQRYLRSGGATQAQAACLAKDEWITAQQRSSPSDGRCGMTKIQIGAIVKKAQRYAADHPNAATVAPN